MDARTTEQHEEANVQRSSISGQRMKKSHLENQEQYLNIPKQAKAAMAVLKQVVLACLTSSVLDQVLMRITFHIISTGFDQTVCCR